MKMSARRFLTPMLSMLMLAGMGMSPATSAVPDCSWMSRVYSWEMSSGIKAKVDLESKKMDVPINFCDKTVRLDLKTNMKTLTRRFEIKVTMPPMALSLVGEDPNGVFTDYALRNAPVTVAQTAYDPNTGKVLGTRTRTTTVNEIKTRFLQKPGPAYFGSIDLRIPEETINGLRWDSISARLSYR